MATPALAQDPAPQPKPAQQEGKAEAPKQEDKKKEDEKNPAAEYEKAIKDLKKVEGAFPLYLRKKEILLELREDQLDKIFMLQLTMHSGLDPFLLQAGIPVGETFFRDYGPIDVYKFVKNEETVQLVRPNVAYQWDKKDPMAVGAERSFPTATLASYKIEQTHPDKKLFLVNISGLFSGDVTRLNENVGTFMPGYAPSREQTVVDWTDGDKNQTVVRMSMNYLRQPGPPRLLPFAQLEDDRSGPAKVTYNLYWREASDYVPRIADPRVGFFTTDFFSFEKYSDKDRKQSYVNRWHLVKKDPDAPLSEPVQPIVWTIDNSIPPQWRDSVKEGILMWNKAFEKAGFKNAIQVEDAPNDPNYDHADARRNVIRFGASDSPVYGAIAIYRNDPFTGHIRNATIVIDASMTQFRYNDFRDVVLPGSFAKERQLQAFLDDPKLPAKSLDAYLFQSRADEQREKFAQHLHAAGSKLYDCQHAKNSALEALFGMAAMSAQPNIKISREEYFKRYLKDTVAHELGHAIGLRHNFAASTFLSTSQLADDKVTSEEGITASVMEYAPVNIQAVLKGNGNFFAPTVGAYDKWVIQYGYTPFKAKDPLAERFETMKIASQSGMPGHAYLTDGDADGWNPLGVRSDLSNDPLNYAKRVVTGVERAKTFAIEKLPAPGTSFDDRTDLLMISVNRIFNQGRVLARYVGGVEERRQYKGDKGQKDTLKPVDAETQREAVAMITTNLFTGNPFHLPTEVLNNLSYEDEGSWPGSPAPVRTLISTQQRSLLALLMSGATTSRIVENAYKQADTGDAYGVDEHYDSLVRAVFAEVSKNQNVSALRRDLQRFMISGLMTQAGAPSGFINEDTRVVASHQLKQIKARLNVQLASTKTLDSMTRIHLRDMDDQVTRFLQRQEISLSE